ncbi:MAG: hypothetical protein Q7S76_01210 [bacterium]|nr:hypothetical protein [bacterium]
MDTQALLTGLPSTLHRFFWDVDASTVNPSTHPHYVINRLLDKGDLAAARWVLKNFSREDIVETLRTIRDFSPWNGRFWSRYLAVPEEEVACLQPSYLKMRRMHWPF